MTRRTRSFLVDNTIGKIFTGVTNVAQAAPDKLIAGTKLLVKSLSTSISVQAVPVKNLGNGKGLFLSSGGALVTKIAVSVSTTARGQPIIVVARKGVAYDSSTEIGTYTLPINTNVAEFPIQVQLDSTESLFFDVTQVGSNRRGSGLTIRVSYYSG